MLRLDAHFTELDGSPDDMVNVDEWPDNIDGALLLSHPIAAALPPVAKLPGLIRYTPQQYDHCFTDLTGSFEDYQKGLQKKSLQELQRKTSAFAIIAGAIWIFANTAVATKWRNSTPSRKVTAMTYQEKLLHVGMPDNPEFLQKLKDRCDSNQTRAYVLMCGQYPIAFSLGWRKPSGVLQGAYLGYDPAYARFSPGNILQMWVLQRFLSEGGYTIYDHGLGEGFHKQFFSTGSCNAPTSITSATRCEIGPLCVCTAPAWSSLAALVVCWRPWASSPGSSPAAVRGRACEEDVFSYDI